LTTFRENSGCYTNGAVPTPILLPNLVSNQLAIALLNDIGGALDLVPPVGLGVDERTLDGDILLVLLIQNLFLGLRALVGLVAFLMALEAYQIAPFSSFFTIFSRLS
jgi:hypothetical protein